MADNYLSKFLQDPKFSQREGEGNYLRQQFPKLYGALGGLLGTAPDEMQGSVLDPLTAQVKQGAEMGYLPGLIASGAPPIKGGAGLAALAGMFVGKGSKTWDALQAAKALQLEKAGVDARKIWSETGTWKGPDGMWRQEIPDNMAKARDYQLTPAKAFEKARLNAVIQDSQPLRDRAESMLPYYDKSKNQLTQEFSKTGSAIVDAALSGDMDLAKKLQSDRSGLSSLLEEMASSTYGPTSSFLKHGDLGKAYPDVYNMHTRIDAGNDVLGGAGGHYNAGNAFQGEQVVLKEKPTFSDAKSMQIHELQHAIQQREGFARGGNPEMFKSVEHEKRMLTDGNILTRMKATQEYGSLDGALELFRQRFKRDPAPGAQSLALSGEAPDEMLKRRDQLLSPEESYRRLAGEAEARATQARIPLNAAQRRALFPADSYDVPMDQLIVRGLPVNQLQKLLK